MSTMSVEELIAEKERISADSSLSPDERKKQLRRIRKQIREGGGSNRSSSEPSERAPRKSKSERSAVRAEKQTAKREALQTSVEKYAEQFREACSRLTEFDPRNGKAGYAFAASLCIEAGVKVTELFQKFEQRWGYKPKEFAVLAKPAETLLMLGPVHAQPGDNKKGKGK